MALRTTNQTGDETSDKFWNDLIADMATIEATLAAVLNGATAQIAAASGKVPLGDGTGKIGNDWLINPNYGDVKVHAVAATTLVTAVEGQVVLDVSDIDTITGSLLANEIKVPANATRALVFGNVQMAASIATADRIYAGITLDGVLDATTVSELEKQSVVSASPSVTPQGMIAVVANQTIGIKAYQDSGANWDTVQAALTVVFR